MTFAAIACGGDDNGGATPTSDIPQRDIVFEGRVDAAVNIYTIDPETAESTQLTTGTSFDGNPGWSPDYERIVFVSDRDRGNRQNDIYTMAADGSDVQRITTGRIESFWSPKFSPDGREIAFSLQQQGEYYLGVMNADGRLGRPLAGPYDFVEFPSWTRDGKEIYFSAIGEGTQAADILAVNVDGETPTVRTVISTPAADVCPHFSRDGTMLTYASSPPGVQDGEPDLFRHDLSSSDTTGANDTRLTTDVARDDYANPSPDGTEYVFVSNRDDNFELYLMNPDGTDQRRLTNTADRRENVPDW
jgi:TolB protein